jgi:Mg-chelatase subunit ChlD
MRKLCSKTLVIFGVMIAGCFGEISMAMAQEKALKLSNNSIDFGKIAAIVYPAKTIEFVNNSHEKLAILLIDKGPNVKVNFQRRFYQPGEKGILSFYYDARNTGEFSEEVKIYSNLDAEPQMVALKGTCISIQECFPNMNNLNLRNILTINKNTQAAVPMAVLTFIHNHNTQKSFNLKMDKNGKAVEELPIGQYSISANIVGYEPYASELFIPKTYPNVVIELTPKMSVPITPAIQTPPPVIQPQPQAIVKTNHPVVTSTDLPEDKYAANNIVLLLDISGSMHAQGKFSLLQQSINNLVMVLRPIDYVTVITYSTNAKLVLPSISGSEKDKITGTIQELVTHGSTQGVKGLNMAYDMASQQFIKGGNNQVILATDGEFSEKNVTDDYYQQFISGYSQKGIKLSILGFGVNHAAIERMKKMTTSGQGSFILIESEKYVKNALINEIKAMSFVGGNEKATK